MAKSKVNTSANAFGTPEYFDASTAMRIVEKYYYRLKDDVTTILLESKSMVEDAPFWNALYEETAIDHGGPIQAKLQRLAAAIARYEAVIKKHKAKD